MFTNTKSKSRKRVKESHSYSSLQEVMSEEDYNSVAEFLVLAVEGGDRSTLDWGGWYTQYKTRPNTTAEDISRADIFMQVYHAQNVPVSEYGENHHMWPVCLFEGK